MNLVKNWGLFENLGKYLTGSGISIETVEVVYKNGAGRSSECKTRRDGSSTFVFAGRPSGPTMVEIGRPCQLSVGPQSFFYRNKVPVEMIYQYRIG